MITKRNKKKRQALKINYFETLYTTKANCLQKIFDDFDGNIRIEIVAKAD